MQTETDSKASIKKLGELITQIQIAMLTTVAETGVLRSRPMGTQQVEFDGDLWFFVGASSPKAQEIQRDPRVNVSYAKPDEQLYISVSGHATLVRDTAKMQELWNPILKAWFPDGLEDPDIALLKIHVEQAEYWDAPSSTFVQLVGFVKAVATGKRAEGLGEHEKINLM